MVAISSQLQESLWLLYGAQLSGWLFMADVSRRPVLAPGCVQKTRDLGCSPWPADSFLSMFPAYFLRYILPRCYQGSSRHWVQGRKPCNGQNPHGPSGLTQLTAPLPARPPSQSREGMALWLCHQGSLLPSVQTRKTLVIERGLNLTCLTFRALHLLPHSASCRKIA